MHNAAFRALGLDYVYVPFGVPVSQLAGAIAGVRALGIVGVNVTVPLKEEVMPLLDSVSPTAKRVGAVNTVVNRKGRLRGENTDVAGFLGALQEQRLETAGIRALVVGGGGVARAVVAALAEAGAGAVTIANRTVRRAHRLADEFRTAAMSTVPIDLPTLKDGELLESVDLVVNATSVGLHGGAFFPLAYAKTPPACLFVDLIYGRRTAFLARAARAHRHTLDGSTMLLHQGAAAFTLWTGRVAPLATMRAALRSATQKHH